MEDAIHAATLGIWIKWNKFWNHCFHIPFSIDKKCKFIMLARADLLCRWVQCGEGKCVASNATLFGFDCECNAGWKQIEIDFIVLPPCIVPNCTFFSSYFNHKSYPKII